MQFSLCSRRCKLTNLTRLEKKQKTKNHQLEWHREFGLVFIAKSCLTPCDPRDISSPGSSVHGVFQARILEWVAISFSRIFPTQGLSPGLCRRSIYWATRDTQTKWNYLMVTKLSRKQRNKEHRLNFSTCPHSLPIHGESFLFLGCKNVILRSSLLLGSGRCELQGPE